MLIKIDEKVYENYPDVEIGYLLAQVHITKTDPFVEELKTYLSKHLKDQNINATNFVVHPQISIWRAIYEENFKVKAKTYRSSIESLLKRVVTGKEMWNVCNVVDLYNCCSILSLLPMGGYDLNKIKGNVCIRYAKEKETFLGLGEKKEIEIATQHIVYADDERVLCWLWNHKDAAETCINSCSKSVIFFIDGFDNPSVSYALKQLAENLTRIHCNPYKMGILNKNYPKEVLEPILFETKKLL